jgi:hypothetical protein
VFEPFKFNFTFCGVCYSATELICGVLLAIHQT